MEKKGLCSQGAFTARGNKWFVDMFPDVTVHVQLACEQASLFGFRNSRDWLTRSRESCDFPCVLSDTMIVRSQVVGVGNFGGQDY